MALAALLHENRDAFPRESRLVAASLVASVLIHAVALSVGGRVPHVHETSPPPRLEVAVRQPEVIAPAPVPPPPPTSVNPRTVTPPAPPKPPPAQPRVRPPDRQVIPAPAPSPAPVAPIAPLEERAAAPARPEAPAKAESGPVAPVVPRTEAPAVATQPDFRAAYLNNPPPRYPLAARRQGEEGTVMLRVLVDRSGRAAGVELERSSGSSRLDQAAIEAVKSWRFVPAKRGSESVDATVLVPIIFKLDGGT